ALAPVVMRELPSHERPRERLLAVGERHLSTRELLAILLRTGTARESALTLADRLLAHAGSLRRLAAMAPEDLLQVPGIGPAKAAQIKAALELARRLALEPRHERFAVRNPRDVAGLLMGDLRDLDREVFKVIMLDTKHRIIAIETLSIGDLSGTLVHPRELFKDAMRRNSAAVILAHNHPSGDPEPSPDDIDLTRRLVAGGRLLGIEVLDHIIIGDNRYVSLKERGFWDAP
ncbi:MAG TPA: DNA repair protein RadC, partial [Limnochordales bacterium]